MARSSKNTRASKGLKKARAAAEESKRRPRQGRQLQPLAEREQRAKKMEQELENLGRGPFRSILAEIIGAQPSPQAMKRFARNYPDRWGQLLRNMASLSGYSDKTVVEHEGSVRVILEMSDSQLEQELQKFDEVIDADFEDVTDEQQS